MAVGLGWKGKIGIKRTTTWGSRTAPAANNQVAVDSASFRAIVDPLRNTAFNSYPIENVPLGGPIRLEGEMSGIFRYAGLERLVEGAFGFQGTWTSVAAANVYRAESCVLDFDGASPDESEDYATHFLSVDIDQSGGLGSFWERYSSMAVQRLEFTYRAGDYLKYTARLIGGGDITTGAADATPYDVYLRDQAAPTSLSMHADHQSHLVLAQHGMFWIRDDDATAVANADRLKVSDWTFFIESDLPSIIDPMSDPYIAIPDRQGVRIGGTFTLPIIEQGSSFSDAEELRDDYQNLFVSRSGAVLTAGTSQIKKMVAAFYYDDGTEKHSVIFLIPGCVLTAMDDFSMVSKGLVPARFTWEAFALTTARAASTTLSNADYFTVNTTFTAGQRLPYMYLQNALTALL